MGKTLFHILFLFIFFISPSSLLLAHEGDDQGAHHQKHAPEEEAKPDNVWGALKFTGQKISQGSQRTGHEIKEGSKTAGRGIKKGGQATGRAFKKAGSSIKTFFVGDDKDDKKD